MLPQEKFDITVRDLVSRGGERNPDLTFVDLLAAGLALPEGGTKIALRVRVIALFVQDQTAPRPGERVGTLQRDRLITGRSGALQVPQVLQGDAQIDIN